MDRFNDKAVKNRNKMILLQGLSLVVGNGLIECDDFNGTNKDRMEMLTALKELDKINSHLQKVYEARNKIMSRMAAAFDE